MIKELNRCPTKTNAVRLAFWGFCLVCFSFFFFFFRKKLSLSVVSGSGELNRK